MLDFSRCGFSDRISAQTLSTAWLICWDTSEDDISIVYPMIFQCQQTVPTITTSKQIERFELKYSIANTRKFLYGKLS